MAVARLRWWSFDVAALDAEGAVQHAAGISPGVGPEQIAAQVARGTWWVQGVVRVHGGGLLGFWLVPGVPPQRCPVVLCRGGEAICLASTAASALPMWLYHHLLDRPERWAELRRQWSTLRRGLQPLHAALGGRDELLGLSELLDDPLLHQALHSAVPAIYWQAVREVHARLDPSPENLERISYVLRAIRKRRAPMPLPGGLGLLEHPASVVAFVTNRAARRAPLDLQAAWAMLRGPAGLGSCLRDGSPDMVGRPDGQRTLLLALEAARLVAERAGAAPEAWRADPQWSVVLTMAEQGDRYDGEAHLGAAAALEQRGAARRAWDALASGACFSALRYEQALPAFLDAAEQLARRQGWTGIREHLDALQHEQQRM